MEQASWIAGHVNAYEFFGGVARIIVPDNLKTGVIKHTRTELLLNKSYQELAEHYGTAIIPARVRTPKDKATVEGAVGIVTTFILASIRNQQFFSLAELNEAIHKRLHEYNHRPFQRKDGSRATRFADERQFLLPLPKQTFELAEWRIATAQKNYHVLVDENFYSVPFEFIGYKIDVRLTRNIVELFYDHNRIASHVRIQDKRGGYSSADEHMPPNHKAYIEWTGDKLRAEASKVGQNTVAVVDSILSSYKVERQAHRACLQLLKLADAYTPEVLELACGETFKYSKTPTLKTVQSILRFEQFKSTDQHTPSDPASHSFTRGAAYYSDGGRE
jgi:transposase